MGKKQNYLITEDGVKLFYQVHEIGAPTWIVVVHGIAEHSQRHTYLTDLLGERFNIFYYDLRGHGQSEGERGRIDRFSHFRDDLTTVLHFLQKEFRMERYALLGHSMGALISADFLQQQAWPDKLPPVFVYLSSPPVGLGGILGEIVRFIPGEIFSKLSLFKKGITLPGMIDFKYLSSDLQIGEEFVQDELNLKTLHTSLLLGLVATAKEVFAKPLRIPSPAVCSVGGEDKIVSVTELVNYFTLIDKSVKIKVFSGARHEIHNEINELREEYLSFVRQQFLSIVTG